MIEPRNMEREGLSKSINPYYRYDLEPFSVCIMIVTILFSEKASSRINYLFIILYFVSGEEEGFLVTIYCVKAPS